MLTEIQYRILKKIYPGDADRGSIQEAQARFDVLLGDEFLSKISGKKIIDFGCGEGVETVALAKRGARRVIGIDIREDVLQTARRRAVSAGVQSSCLFTSSTEEVADIIVSIDAFEHFADPATILRIMDRLLRPAGEVFVSFGPCWYHPLGGHLFSVFPWAHLLFSEQALIRWRSTFKTDGATRFAEVAGGLNQMTIRKFEELIQSSTFQLGRLELVPIRKLRILHNHLTREFTTAIVRCRLVKQG